MNDNLTNRSFHAVIWNYVGGVTKIFAQLIIQIWLARTLGPEVFGQYATVLVVIGFGWLLSDAGFGTALIQKSEITDEDVSYALGWVLLVSVLVGITVTLVSPWVAEYMRDPSLKLPLMACGPIIALQALANLSTSLIRRKLNMKRLQTIQVSAYLVGFGFISIPLAYLNSGVWSLVIGFFVQTLITFIFGYLTVRHTLKPRLSGDIALRNFGGNVLGTNMSNWAIDNLDRFIIGKQWGITALGAYAAAFNLSRAPTGLLVSTVQSVVLSTASRVQSDLSLLRRGYAAVLSLSALLTFPFFALLAFKAEFVIHLLYGELWNDAIPLFAAFCIVIPFYVLLSVTGPVLWAMGLVSTEFKVQFCTALLLITGLILLADFPLNVVIWFIPCLYFIRFFFVYLLLAKRIELSHKEAIYAMLGGAALSVAVIAVLFLTDKLMSITIVPQIWMEFTQIILAALAVVGILHWFPGKLIGKDLTRFLLSRSVDSKFAKVLCKLIALKGTSS